MQTNFARINLQWTTLDYDFSNIPILSCHNITEILLKVALNTLTLFFFCGSEIKDGHHSLPRGCRGRMVVGLTTAYAISAYHHLSCEFKPCSWQGVLNTTL
jgi:hypothetical protein